MIKEIISYGRYLMDNAITNTTYNTSIYTGHGIGNVRFDTVTGQLQSFDGRDWYPIFGNTVSIALTPEADILLDWAKEQRDKQLMFENMTQSSSLVSIALENLNNAKAQLEATYILSKEHNL